MTDGLTVPVLEGVFEGVLVPDVDCVPETEGVLEGVWEPVCVPVLVCDGDPDCEPVCVPV